MTAPVLRRFGAVAASAALFATVATIAAPANASAPTTPLSQGAAWVSAQVNATSHLVHDGQYNFDDIGGSIAAVYDLQTAGGYQTQVDAMVTAVGQNLTANAGYIQADEYASTPPYAKIQTGHYATPTANALVFAEAMGQDPTNYNSVDLVSAMEARIATTTGATGGKIADDSSYGDYANSIGQALAARGLAAASTSTGSAYATSALAFLLKQQCSAGYFRLYAAAGPDNSWTCDSGIATGKSAADLDTTAWVAEELRPLALTNVDAARALGRAESWILAQQRADGSFGGGPSTPAPNANSTGLAGTVLGELDHTDAATKAAVWIRQHQAQSTACASALSTQTGAIAYNDAALAAGAKNGIPNTTAGQWRSATFQALPVLQWAPTTGSTLKAAATTSYVQAGKSTNVTVSGLVPGAAACITSGAFRVSAAAGLNGSAIASVLMPAGTANRTVTVNDGTTTASAVVKVLSAKTFGIAVPLKPHAGQIIRITASGLASGEKVTLRYGKLVRVAKATAKGVYTTTISAGPIGRRSLVVTGQFANRRVARTLTVVR